MVSIQGRLSVAIMGLVGVAGVVMAGNASLGQGKATEKPQTLPPGSVTGTITNAKKQSVSNAAALIKSGVMITAEEQQSSGVRNPDAFGRGIFGTGETSGRRAASDVNAGGLYTLDKLRPGVYNLMVEAGAINVTLYRPQRLMGVVVRPGKETALDITLHEGTGLEEVGEPMLSVPKLQQYGWMEGTITNADGKPVDSARALIASGISFTIKKGAETMGSLKTDHMAGGFFSIQNCIPGTYSFLVEAGSLPGKKFRPQLISNVVIKPGIRTLLKIVMSEGEGLERVEAPSVKMQPVKLLSDG